MTQTVSTTCKGCGLVLTADDEDELVSRVEAHLTEAHPGHRPSRKHILAVIRKRKADES